MREIDSRMPLAGFDELSHLLPGLISSEALSGMAPSRHVSMFAITLVRVDSSLGLA